AGGRADLRLPRTLGARRAGGDAEPDAGRPQSVAVDPLQGYRSGKQLLHRNARFGQRLSDATAAQLLDLPRQRRLLKGAPLMHRIVARWPALATLALAGCSPQHILDVQDPDVIPVVNSASGAMALRNGVILRLEQATNGIQGPDALFVYTGLLADEYRSGDTFVQRNDMDQRLFDPTNTFLAGPLRSLNRVRVEGLAAAAALQTYMPTPRSNIGLTYALVAYSMALMGESYCNGI